MKWSPERRAEVERRFCEEYVIDLNGSRAAHVASGICTRDSAEVTAHRLLKRPAVRALIAKLEAKRFAKCNLSAEKVLEEVQRLAFANTADFYTPDPVSGKLVFDPSKLLHSNGRPNRDLMAAIEEIKEDTTGGSGDGERRLVLRTTIRLASKTKNLELLMRHLALLNDKIDLNVKAEDIIAAISEGKERAKTL